MIFTIILKGKTSIIQLKLNGSKLLPLLLRKHSFLRIARCEEQSFTVFVYAQIQFPYPARFLKTCIYNKHIKWRCYINANACKLKKGIKINTSTTIELISTFFLSKTHNCFTVVTHYLKRRISNNQDFSE